MALIDRRQARIRCLIHLSSRLIVSWILVSSVAGCAVDSYEVAPYSERNSVPLIASGQLPSDPVAERKKMLLGRAKSIHLYYRPQQAGAFPLVGDYREVKSTRAITNESEIARFLDELEHDEEEETPGMAGTLHIVVEFEGLPEAAAYLIVYGRTGTITPVFSRDAAGFAGGSFLTWVLNRYPRVMSGTARGR